MLHMSGVTRTWPCSRCDGKGEIRAFGHVLGGVCFKCGGCGKQASKPSLSVMWVVLDSNGQQTYNIRAKTSSQAIAKALVTFQGASAEWRGAHDMSNPSAVTPEEWNKPNP